MKFQLQHPVFLRNVSFNYGNGLLLRDVNLLVDYGEAVAIMGRSGAGKTTLLKIISGLLKPTGGYVEVFGCPMSFGCVKHIRRRIAYIPQNLALIESETALYNVLLARAPNKPLRFITSLWSRSDVEEALGVLKAVGLGDKAKTKVEKLSGGEKQRVAIARAIFQRADVLLADEPVSSLDFDTAEAIVDMLISLKSKGITIIAVMHDRELAFKYFDKIYVLENGVLK